MQGRQRRKVEPNYGGITSSINNGRAIEGNQDEILPMDKFGGYKTQVKETTKTRERLALRKVEVEEHFEIYWRLRKGSEWNVFLRPIRLRKNAETTISCRPGLARKKKEVYHQSGGGRNVHRCALVAYQSSRTHFRENVKHTRRNGMCWRWGK